MHETDATTMTSRRVNSEFVADNQMLPPSSGFFSKTHPVPARDLAKAQSATQAVRDQAALGGSLELVELDLANLARHVTLRAPTRQMVAALLEKCPGDEELAELVDPEAERVFRAWADGREAIS